LNISDLEELKSEWEKLVFFNKQEFDKGLERAIDVTKNWNEQPNPGKVFIKGRRVHHGAAGAALVAVGIIGKSSQTLGFAYGLMEDDFDDAEDWFKFEKGGDPKSFLSIEQRTNFECYQEKTCSKL